MPTRQQERLLLFGKGIPIATPVARVNDVFKVKFTYNITAPVLSISGDIGSFVGQDNNSISNITNGVWLVNGSPGVGDGLRSAVPYSFKQGRALLFCLPAGTTSSTRIRFGLSSTLLNNGTDDYVITGAGEIRDSAGAFDQSITFGDYSAYVFVQIGSQIHLYASALNINTKVSWTWLWAFEKSQASPLYVKAGLLTTAGAVAETLQASYFRVYDSVDSLFQSPTALVPWNVASPTLGNVYTTSTDDAVEVTFTAAALLAGTASIKFKKIDALNYCEARLDNAGALDIWSVIGGSDTTHHLVSAIAGVATNGADVTFRIRMSTIANTTVVYTKVGDITSSNIWTKRGSAFAVHATLAAGTGAEINATSYTAKNFKTYVGRSDALDRACTEVMPFILGVGDSIMFGLGGTASQAFLVQMCMQLWRAGIPCYYKNAGVGGDKITDVASKLPGNVAAYLNVANRPVEVVLIEGGTNDMLGGLQTGLQVYNNIASTCSSVRKPGRIVVYTSPIARDPQPGGDPAWQTQWADLLTRLRADNSFCDLFIDFAANAAFDSITDANNANGRTDYVAADKTHTLPAGSLLLGTIAATPVHDAMLPFFLAA